MVIAALATLLLVALMVMFFYSRKAVKEQALMNAEQTLETTVQHIDNILLDIEQSTGNIYWKVVSHVNEPDMMHKYSRILVENNPNIAGCAIALEPHFYKNQELFMAYYYREKETDENSRIISSDTFGEKPYNEQKWYTGVMKSGVPLWTDPMKNNTGKNNAITSFSLPIYVGQDRVGVLAVDVSLALLSEIVLESKPSPNSFSTLLGKTGTYIVHPNSNKLNHNVFELAKKGSDPSVIEAAQAMITGERGYKYVNLDGEDCYVFYKPFERSVVPGRSMTNLGWSAGIVYPENDIFGDYNRLLYIVLAVALIGLLLLLLLCQAFINRQLRPLALLTNSAQRIEEGHYDETIPDSKQVDEVGRLQKNFQIMQQSLTTRMNEMKQLTDTLEERGRVLQAAYNQAQVAERMKTQFLYNMSNQMMAPANSIYTSVMTVCNDYSGLTEEKTCQLVDEIQQQGGIITELLNQLIADSEKEMIYQTEE